VVNASKHKAQVRTWKGLPADPLRLNEANGINLVRKNSKLRPKHWKIEFTLLRNTVVRLTCWVELRCLVSIIFIVERIFTPWFSFCLGHVFSLCLLQDWSSPALWIWSLCRLHNCYQMAVTKIRVKQYSKHVPCMCRNTIHTLVALALMELSV
jgi:hypothetical protein